MWKEKYFFDKNKKNLERKQKKIVKKYLKFAKTTIEENIFIKVKQWTALLINYNNKRT